MTAGAGAGTGSGGQGGPRLRRSLPSTNTLAQTYDNIGSMGRTGAGHKGLAAAAPPGALRALRCAPLSTHLHRTPSPLQPLEGWMSARWRLRWPAPLASSSWTSGALCGSPVLLECCSSWAVLCMLHAAATLPPLQLSNNQRRRVQGLDATAARSFVTLNNRLQRMGVQVRREQRCAGKAAFRPVAEHVSSTPLSSAAPHHSPAAAARQHPPPAGRARTHPAAARRRPGSGSRSGGHAGAGGGALLRQHGRRLHALRGVVSGGGAGAGPVRAARRLHDPGAGETGLGGPLC